MLITNHDPYMEMLSVPRIANLETLHRKSRNSQFTNPETLSKNQKSFDVYGQCISPKTNRFIVEIYRYEPQNFSNHQK